MAERQPLLFVDNTGTSGILTDTEIRKAVNGRWLISPDTFQESSLEASSYDVRVGAKGVLGGDGTELDLRTVALELGPGTYAGIISHENFALPENICARIGSKRALAYDGIILLTGTTIDPGYEGHLLFCVYNASQRKVLIRHNKKLCNVVFERLSKAPERVAPADASLKLGNFPDSFLDRMANMEVLPWVQISERVKQIETITKDILDLKARYDDVLQPIRELTSNVQSLSQDVDTVNKAISENSKQINQLTTNLGTVGVHLQGLQERAKNLEDADKSKSETITTLRTSVGRFQLLVYIFWAILLLVAGAALSRLFNKQPTEMRQSVDAPTNRVPPSDGSKPSP